MAVPIIKIENARGEVLDLSTDPRYEPILGGTAPPKATINRAKVSTADGTRFNSATVGERNLLLTIYLRQDVARARLNLYKYITSKGFIRVYYQADGLDLYIDGYVEAAEVDPWVLGQNMQVSIICPQPFWRDVSETCTDASVVSGLFSFPFAIDSAGVELSIVDTASGTLVQNNGQVESGVIFEFKATIRSLQPRIYNLGTGEFIGFYVDMFAGERLVVNTADGEKSATLITTDGTRKNVLNTFMEGGAWLKLAPGTNELSYTVDEGEMELRVYHTNMYQGV